MPWPAMYHPVPRQVPFPNELLWTPWRVTQPHPLFILAELLHVDRVPSKARLRSDVCLTVHLCGGTRGHPRTSRSRTRTVCASVMPIKLFRSAVLPFTAYHVAFRR